jgi:sulfate adenylyltransferase subunit 1 (EFTu-like GTPase family)
VHAIPLSALNGDNVTEPSPLTPWFEGPSLLEYLETVEIERGAAGKPFRFPVQLVLRPDHDFRGYAGQIASGTIRVGDPVTVWPSGLTTTVQRIVTWDGDLTTAAAPMSVTLALEHEIDISRGDLIAAGAIERSRRFEANLVWMDERPLTPGRVYVLKHSTRVVTAEVDRGLALNEIGLVNISASRPLVFDAYDTNRHTGSFVLIDAATNFTAGAGMIVRPVGDDADEEATALSAAARIAQAAREAANGADAEVAVRRLLEEILQ